MHVFLSFAGEDRETVAPVAALLRASGYTVFFDRQVLEAGKTYHDDIRRAVFECDMFIFFVSASALRPGKYCLTELGYAAERWPNPTGKVLPVALSPELPPLPPYLGLVTVLPLSGNVAAAVLDHLRADRPGAASEAAPQPLKAAPQPLVETTIELSRVLLRAAATAGLAGAVVSLVLSSLAPRRLLYSEYVGIFAAAALLVGAATAYARFASKRKQSVRTTSPERTP